jgi:hypothetical protein
LSGSVALGLVLSFEGSTKDARMGVGTFSKNCNASDDAYLPENHVALNHSDIKLTRKLRGKNNIDSGNAALLRKPSDDDPSIDVSLGNIQAWQPVTYRGTNLDDYN